MTRALPTMFEQSEATRADYDMAKTSRLRKRRIVPSQGSHADYHYRSESDYLKCMEYARDAVRNDVICNSMLETVDVNTVQDGFTLDWQTGSDSLDKTLAGMWDAWAYDPSMCDIAEEHEFCAMESMALLGALTDGDIWSIGLDEGSLMWREAHRARTPSRTERKNIVHGVELSGVRKRLRVWMTKEEIDPYKPTLVRDFVQYPFRDDDGVRRVFQVYTRTVKRFSQTRGITAFSPMFDLFGMHDDTQFNAIVKQQVLNAIVAFRERTADYEENAPASAVGEQTTQVNSSLQSELVTRIGPVTLIDGKKGEKMTAFASSAPGAEFLPHVKMILTLLGVNLGLPLVLVLKDASETNFSGWRGAFEQAKMGFKRNQNCLIRRFHEPVLQWKIAQWMSESPGLRKEIEAVLRQTRTLGHTWHKPTWPYIEPLTDRQADKLSIDNYLEAPSGVMSRNGQDYETVGKRCIFDRGQMIRWAKEEAKSINEQFPDDEIEVNWKDLYLPPTAAKISGMQPSSDPPEPAPKPGGTNATRP